MDFYNLANPWTNTALKKNNLSAFTLDLDVMMFISVSNN